MKILKFYVEKCSKLHATPNISSYGFTNKSLKNLLAQFSIYIHHENNTCQTGTRKCPTPLHPSLLFPGTEERRHAWWFVPCLMGETITCRYLGKPQKNNKAMSICNAHPEKQEAHHICLNKPHWFGEAQPHYIHPSRQQTPLHSFRSFVLPCLPADNAL